MAEASDVSRFFTTGEIAREVGVKLHMVTNIVRSRRIKHVGRAGIARLFDLEGVRRIVDALAEGSADQFHIGDPAESQAEIEEAERKRAEAVRVREGLEEWEGKFEERNRCLEEQLDAKKDEIRSLRREVAKVRAQRFKVAKELVAAAFLEGMADAGKKQCEKKLVLRRELAKKFGNLETSMPAGADVGKKEARRKNGDEGNENG